MVSFTFRSDDPASYMRQCMSLFGPAAQDGTIWWRGISADTFLGGGDVVAKRHSCYGSSGCPVEAALEIIGAKWKGATVYHLLDGELRFSELRRRMPNVTQRVLSKALKELEADGILTRHVTPAVPPQVSYKLTTKGENLKSAVLALAAFGRGHLDTRADAPISAAGAAAEAAE